MQTYRRRKIHQICKSIWDKYGLVAGFDFSYLLPKLNVEYKEESFEDNNISAILLIKGSKSLITANAYHHINRKRFSIGHELGHLLLGHKKDIDIKEEEKIFFRNEISSMGINNDEIEANYFSANLLMPEHILKESIDLNSSFEDNVANLAGRFVVSQASMTLRLNHIGFC